MYQLTGSETVKLQWGPLVDVEVQWTNTPDCQVERMPT